MRIEKYRRRYGDGHLFGKMSSKAYEQFLLKSTSLRRARALGWSNACPVVPELLIKRSPEEMEKRYTEVNYWFGYTVQTLKNNGRRDLANKLTRRITREPDEKIGHYSSDWIPDELKKYMYGPGGPHGYNFPRLMTAFIGKEFSNKPANKNGEMSRARRLRANRMFVAMDCFEMSVRDLGEHDGLDELLVTFSERLMETKRAKRISLLKNTISNGKLTEDNCLTAYGGIFSAMADKTQLLQGSYANMGDRTKKRLGIAILPISPH